MLSSLMLEGTVEESLLLQAVRRSLRGTARQTLIPLGGLASSKDILHKLDTLFGNVSSAESILQRFYTEVQQEKETVTAYGCRLESLLQNAIQAGHVSESSRNDMLRSKYFGLDCEMIA